MFFTVCFIFLTYPASHSYPLFGKLYYTVNKRIMTSFVYNLKSFDVFVLVKIKCIKVKFKRYATIN